MRQRPPPGFTLVKSLPRLNSGRFHRDNRAYAHPLCGLGYNRYQLTNGWTILGWATPPYEGSGYDAIVYEKHVPANTDGNGLTDHMTPGIYWCHGDADKMWFCVKLPAEFKDEYEPWL